MKTFDGNLSAYHTLNALNVLYVERQQRRAAEASTREGILAIFKEGNAHFKEQRKLYKELGDEMVKIMDVKWWQFWK